MTQEKLYLNGIDGVTGKYLVPPLDYSQAAAIIKDKPPDNKLVGWLESIWRTISEPHLGLPLGVEPSDVKQAGWAVVFHNQEDQAVKDALARLVKHRQKQIGDDSKVKVLQYRDQDGDSHTKWLARHKVSSGSVEPTKVPYYLLLVGSPERIPFLFGHLLSVEYVVGRLHFDTSKEYEDYVESLIDYETSQAVPNAREAVFFATRHPSDRATKLSADVLVNGLADGTPAKDPQPAQPGVAERWEFRTRKLWGKAATKAALSETLGPATGAKPPAFLFTATHGVGWPLGDARQHSAQGALVCQDWSGVGSDIGSEDYFAAADVPSDGRVQGMITFHFACYGAGTPSYDRFVHEPRKSPPQIAETPFIAALPKSLLAHPRGGTLACIGHVDRAWPYSIGIPPADPQLLPFQNAIGLILTGQPVGYAMKDFRKRYASLSTTLSSLLEKAKTPGAVSDLDLALRWVERNDAEGYVVLGDPAVQLRVNDLG